MAFQRARNDEQREVRRKAILETAIMMLDEMPVAEISLNELSRRVGLAKSNVLRYFESREAVLLELLDDFLGHWLDDLSKDLAAGIEAGAAPDARATQLAEILSQSLANRAVLCDLFGAQGGVLEHNVSIDVAKRHKRSSLVRLEVMTELVLRHVPELDGDAQLFCLMSLVSAGALSSYFPPPPSILAAYVDEPELDALHLDFQQALQASFTSMLMGALPRT